MIILLPLVTIASLLAGGWLTGRPETIGVSLVSILPFLGLLTRRRKVAMPQDRSREA